MNTTKTFFRTDSNNLGRGEMFAMLAVCDLFGAMGGLKGKMSITADWRFVWV